MSEAQVKRTELKCWYKQIAGRHQRQNVMKVTLRKQVG